MKDRYFIVTLPDFISQHKDSEGRDRWYYLTIPKPAPIRPIAMVMESCAERLLTGRWPERDFWRAAKEALSIVPTPSLPPTVAALLGYLTNTDFWTFRRTWRGPEVTPEAEQYSGTHPILVALGETFNLSPERLGNAVGTVIPSYNPFVAAFTEGSRYILSDLSDDQKAELQRQVWPELTALGRIVRVTSPREAERMETLRDAGEEEAARRHLQNVEVDRRLDRGDKPGRIVKEYIGLQPKADQDRLEDRLLFRFRHRGVDPWWVSLRSLPPPARAAEFYARYMDSTPDERRSLTQRAKALKGILTEDCNRELRRLRAVSEAAEPNP